MSKVLKNKSRLTNDVRSNKQRQRQHRGRRRNNHHHHHPIKLGVLRHHHVLVLLLLLLVLSSDVFPLLRPIDAWKFRRFFHRNNNDHQQQQDDHSSSTGRRGRQHRRQQQEVRNSDVIGDKNEVLRKNQHPSDASTTASAASVASDDNISGDDSGWFSWLAASSANAADNNNNMEHVAAAAAEVPLSEEEVSFLMQRLRSSLTLPSSIVERFRKGFEQLKSVVLYKPPVGIVALLAGTRLLLSGRIFRLYKLSDNVEDVLFLQSKPGSRRQRKERWRGRSWKLDRADAISYGTYGGVEPVRRRLCWVALTSLLQQQLDDNDRLDMVPPAPQQSSAESTTTTTQLLQAATDAMFISAPPAGGRVQFIQELVGPVARLEEALAKITAKNNPDKLKSNNRLGNILRGNMSRNSPCTIHPDQVEELVTVSAVTAQVRLTDALLRLCRDRILQTTYRLARTVEHWERRIKYTRNLKDMYQRIFRTTIESDRLRLSLAKAAYLSEVNRLGEITALLMDRPRELEESVMVQALKASEERTCNQERLLQHADLPASPRKQKFWQFARLFKLPVISKYSFRWKADGKGFLSIRKFDESDGFIDGPAAVEVLLGSTTSSSPSSGSGNESWMEEAKDWTQSARNMLCVVVNESLKGSSASSLPEDCSEREFADVQAQFCSSGSAGNDATKEEIWHSLVNYVDMCSTWRRVGEGQKIRIREAFGLWNWLEQFDVLGIPSSLLLVYGSHIVHERLVKKYWERMRRETVGLAKKIAEILEQRVWVPAKEIYDDLMNKSPSMMAGLGLDLEETSLDHMLRDLNFGDGTPETRKEALQKAAEQYERDLSSGLFANIARGRLVRLLLVQVQQLKVGLLSALDSIDVLMKGNRINFNILAAIPAVIMATYGTRYFLRSLYNIRAKDIRPITVVHSEMTHYLNKMENILLLSDDNVDMSSSEGSGTAEAIRTSSSATTSSWSKTRLDAPRLGEMVLHMHRYLILLDFSSPPFPAWSCDQIHQNLQEILSTDGTLKTLDTDRQLRWLVRIREKHSDLVKHL